LPWPGFGGVIRTQLIASYNSDSPQPASIVTLYARRSVGPTAVISDPLIALLDVVAILDDLGLSYAIGGSVASSVFGEPRASADADLIVELSEAQLAGLVGRLEGAYYVSEDAARDAVRRHACFNIIHLESMYKVDLFVAGATQLDREQLRRRVRITLPTDPAATAFVTAPENLVLRKLDWYRQSNETSDRQWRDVLGILKVQAGSLDTTYLERHADAAGLRALLERALQQATPDND
jgi:hypothetical protein